MNRLITFVVCLFAISSALTGCAGFSSVAPPSALAGTYGASYSNPSPRAMASSTGTLTLAVASNGQITITIVDSISGTFVGTGVANHVGGFFITCNGVNGRQTSVSGSLKGTGLGRTASGTIAGSITAAYSADFLGSPDVTLYTNHYEGLYEQGSVGGNWFGDVDASGHFTGMLIVTADSSTIPISGNVYSNGSFKFQGTTKGTKYEVTGNFNASTAQSIVTNGIIKGTTSVKTVSGTWSGHNSAGG